MMLGPLRVSRLTVRRACHSVERTPDTIYDAVQADKACLTRLIHKDAIDNQYDRSRPQFFADQVILPPATRRSTAERCQTIDARSSKLGGTACSFELTRTIRADRAASKSSGHDTSRDHRAPTRRAHMFPENGRSVCHYLINATV